MNPSPSPRSQVGKGLRTDFRGYLLRGLLVLVPLGITAYALVLCYTLTAGHLAPLIRKYAIDLSAPAVAGLSVALFFAALYLIGLAAAMMAGRRVLALAEGLVRRIPVVKTVYAASKQVVDILAQGGGGAGFQSAVVVGFPNPAIKVIAFETGVIAVEGEGAVRSVFVPTTPNPTSGYLILFRTDDVQQSDLDVETAFKTVMSAGILAPPVLRFGGAVEGPALRAPLDREVPHRPAPPSAAARVYAFIRNRLLSGLIVMVPIAVTVFVTRFLYELTAGRIAPLTAYLIGERPVYIDIAVSIALLAAMLYVTGYIATVVVGKRLIRLGERLIARIPVVTSVYGASKQVMESFVEGDSASRFQDPVLVEFPYPGARTIGFVMGQVGTVDGPGYYKVFVPTTPNVTVGILLLYEAHAVQGCDMTVEEAVKLVVSGGIIHPKALRLKPVAPVETAAP